MAGSAPARKVAPKAAPSKAAAAKKASPAPAGSPRDEIVPGVPASSADTKVAEDFDGFDLDGLDKHEVLPDVTDKPFEFLLGGHVYRMLDPRDVDWKRVLDGISNPILFMRLAINDAEESDRFVAEPLPGWKLSALFDRWQKHYGVDSIVDLNQLLSGREIAQQ